MNSFSYAQKNISTTFRKIYSKDDRNYFPISNYWLNIGYIEFPKTLQYEKKGLSKFIRNNQYFLDMGNFAFSAPIPNKDEMMNYFINKIGSEEKFIQETLQSSKGTLPKIKILWSDYRCHKENKSSFSNNNMIPIQDIQYKPCMFEEKKEFFTNTQNGEVYSIYSEKNQNIKIKIFPVDQRKYIFDSYSEFESWTSVVLFLVDPILDYYNLRVAFIDWNNKWNLSFSQDKIIKKYQIVQYNRVWKYWDTFLTYWIFPYYEVELELSIWINKLKIDYLTYTVGDDYWYYISE